jgi:hypothetical protein
MNFICNVEIKTYLLLVIFNEVSNSFPFAKMFQFYFLRFLTIFLYYLIVFHFNTFYSLSSLPSHQSFFYLTVLTYNIV